MKDSSVSLPLLLCLVLTVLSLCSKGQVIQNTAATFKDGIATSYDASYTEGYHEVTWRRTENETSGLYVATLRVGNVQKQMRVVLR